MKSSCSLGLKYFNWALKAFHLICFTSVFCRSILWFSFSDCNNKLCFWFMSNLLLISLKLCQPLVSVCSLSSPLCGRILFGGTAPNGLCFVCCIVFIIIIFFLFAFAAEHQLYESTRSKLARAPVRGDVLTQPLCFAYRLCVSVCACVSLWAWVCLRLTGRSPGGMADCHTPIKWKTNCMHRGRMCTLRRIGSFQNLCPLWGGGQKRMQSQFFTVNEELWYKSTVSCGELGNLICLCTPGEWMQTIVFCVAQQDAPRLPRWCVHTHQEAEHFYFFLAGTLDLPCIIWMEQRKSFFCFL